MICSLLLKGKAMRILKAPICKWRKSVSSGKMYTMNSLGTFEKKTAFFDSIEIKNSKPTNIYIYIYIYIYCGVRNQLDVT